MTVLLVGSPDVHYILLTNLFRIYKNSTVYLITLLDLKVHGLEDY